MFVEISIIVGAVVAGAAGIQHFYDRYAPNGLYRRSFQQAQNVRAELSGLNVTLPNAIKEAVSAIELPDLPTLDLSAPLREFRETLTAIPAAVSEGLASVMASAVGSEYAPKATASREQNREINVFAKVGAKKLALAAAGGFHPAAGTGLAIANAMGIIDDSSLEKFAEILIDNPELMARLNAAGQRIQAGRGSPGGNGGGYSPGLRRR